MVWVESEPLGVLCVGLCDELEGCEAFKCLEPFAKMKDGTTHLAYKPEHAVDLDTGAVVISLKSL